MWVRSLSWEYPLEEGKATHSSIHAWRIPCTEESGLPNSSHVFAFELSGPGGFL